MLPSRASADDATGRTGYQSVSPRRLAVAAVLTLLPLLALTALGFSFPAVAFFAVGAGAGYSLSGSV